MPTTMTRAALNTIVYSLAAAQVAADPAGVTAETHLFLDLNFDSLDAVDYTMELEDAFSISVPDNIAEDLKTAGQVANAVAEILGIE